jgi:hypothetical protein
LGDVNLLYRFAQSERVAWYLGAGVRYLIDDASDAGLNILYGCEFYPVKPLSASVWLDAGTLGDAGVFHTRATLGYQFGRLRVFGGYDFYRIESVNLQGPMMGVLVWW